MQEFKISQFIPALQLLVIADLIDTEEGSWYSQKVRELGTIIGTMPATYDQDGKGDEAIVYLHYFSGGANWYITEKDATGVGTQQAFGYAEVHAGEGELGYISIAELVRSRFVELDLHWTPRTLRECMLKHEDH